VRRNSFPFPLNPGPSTLRLPPFLFQKKSFFLPSTLVSKAESPHFPPPQRVLEEEASLHWGRLRSWSPLFHSPSLVTQPSFFPSQGRRQSQQCCFFFSCSLFPCGQSVSPRENKSFVLSFFLRGCVHQSLYDKETLMMETEAHDAGLENSSFLTNAQWDWYSFPTIREL